MRRYFTNVDVPCLVFMNVHNMSLNMIEVRKYLTSGISCPVHRQEVMFCAALNTKIVAAKSQSQRFAVLTLEAAGFNLLALYVFKNISVNFVLPNR